ncbi:MAG: multidrug effflux MFS transporter [Parabacteroides sp.]
MKRITLTYRTFLLCLLGMLSAFGPFVTDMYLPALPQLQAYFQTDASHVQLSLSTSMLGLAAGQIFFGPLSDKSGRKPIILASLWLFIVSTIACIFSPTIEQFIVWRLLQGIGGAGGIVLSRSIATDCYWGANLAKMMAFIGAIHGIAPVSAPVLGGTMTDSLGWRGIFTFLLILGFVLLLCSHRMRESLAPEHRSSNGLWRTFTTMGQILHNKRFVYLLLQYGFCGGIFFAYIASSPFIIQQHYGFSAFIYSLIFGMNAVIFGLGAAASMKFKSAQLCTHVGSIGVTCSATLLLISLGLEVPFVIFEIAAIFQLFCIGLCFSSSVALAMNEEHDRAGAASALVGAIVFVFGGIVSPLVGMGNILLSTGLIFLICAFCALFFDLRYKAVTRKK